MQLVDILGFSYLSDSRLQLYQEFVAVCPLDPKLRGLEPPDLELRDHGQANRLAPTLVHRPLVLRQRRLLDKNPVLLLRLSKAEVLVER